jgi:DNA-binding transcriptional regulator LsrR (DeoR family)
MDEQNLQSLLDEMREMKMLLILQLLKAGVKQGQIARVLKISEATMSRMLPTGLAKSFE